MTWVARKLFSFFSFPLSLCLSLSQQVFPTQKTNVCRSYTVANFSHAMIWSWVVCRTSSLPIGLHTCEMQRWDNNQLYVLIGGHHRSKARRDMQQHPTTQEGSGDQGQGCKGGPTILGACLQIIALLSTPTSCHKIQKIKS